MQSAQEVFAVVSIQHHDLYLQGQSLRQSGGVLKPLIPQAAQETGPHTEGASFWVCRLSLHRKTLFKSL